MFCGQAGTGRCLETRRTSRCLRRWIRTQARSMSATRSKLIRLRCNRDLKAMVVSRMSTIRRSGHITVPCLAKISDSMMSAFGIRLVIRQPKGIQGMARRRLNNRPKPKGVQGGDGNCFTRALNTAEFQRVLFPRLNPKQLQAKVRLIQYMTVAGAYSVISRFRAHARLAAYQLGDSGTFWMRPVFPPSASVMPLPATV